MKFIKYRNIIGKLVESYKSGKILYQPDNGIKGAYVWIPTRGYPFVGTLSQCRAEAKELKSKKTA